MTWQRSTHLPAAASTRSPLTLFGLAACTVAGALVATTSLGAPEPVRENREIRSPVRSTAPSRPTPPPPPPRRASPPPPPPSRSTSPPARPSRVQRERFDRDRVQERVDRRRVERERWRDERNLDRNHASPYTPPSAPVVDRGRVVEDDRIRDRRRRARHYRYGYYHRPYYGSFRIGLGYYEPCYFGFYSPFTYWPTWRVSPYRSSRRLGLYPDRGYGYGYGRGRSYDYGHAMGALDVDVRPDEALVFIDGQPIGKADEFDGFPRYLWLEEGTYELAVYLPGYETIFRQVTIYPGLVIDVDDVLRDGESIHPDDHGPSSTRIRDERLRREAEKQARAAAIAAERAEIERTILESAERAAEAERSDEAGRSGLRPPVSQDDGDIGRLVFDIVPSDAAVYLDGHFLGVGDEVSRLRSGFVLEPGEHRLEVTRPGYRTRNVPIVIDAGERLEIIIEMEADG
ncbi:MAG: PEGA domain-containing protein [Acidobacteriota bacterium]